MGLGKPCSMHHYGVICIGLRRHMMLYGDLGSPCFRNQMNLDHWQRRPHAESAEEFSLVCVLCFNDLYFWVLLPVFRSTEAPGALAGMMGLCKDLAFHCYSSLRGVIMLQLTHKQEKAGRLSAVFNFTLDKKAIKNLFSVIYGFNFE